MKTSSTSHSARTQQINSADILTALWLANEAKIKETDDPIERAFLYGRKDAINEIEGKLRSDIESM